MTDFSRGDYADLPAGTTDLENNYSAPDLTAIASNDNSTYALQTANNEIAIHQYKKTVAGQYTNIVWSGKSSLAPSDSPVIMEVYNVDAAEWQELDRDDSTAADTDFDITYNGLATADYVDGGGKITWRVYQAASAGPLTKTFGDKTGTNYAGAIDAHIRSDSADTNMGTDAGLWLRCITPATDGFQFFIEFTGLSNIPAEATITAASLFVYFAGRDAPGTYPISLYRVMRNWVETEVTWNSWATGSSWATGGGTGTGDSSASASASVSINTAVLDAPYWLEFTDANLIADIQNIVDSVNSNYGWLFRLTATSSNNFLYFYSREYAVDATLRPYLSVTYTV